MGRHFPGARFTCRHLLLGRGGEGDWPSKAGNLESPEELNLELVKLWVREGFAEGEGPVAADNVAGESECGPWNSFSH